MFRTGAIDLSQFPCRQLNGSFCALSAMRKTVQWFNQGCFDMNAANEGIVFVAAISGLSHDCSTWDELYEDDDGEHPNAWNAPTSSNAPKPTKKAKTMASGNGPATVWNAPTSSNAPKPTKKAKTMASGNGPATVLSEVANALNPGAEVVLRMNANAKAK
eukprot:s2071_g12.t1